MTTLLLNLGTACRETGRLEEAIQFYQELVVAAELLPENEPERRLMHMMGLYCLALVYQSCGEERLAFRYCRAALGLSHESVGSLIDKCLDLQKALGLALFRKMGGDE